MASDKRTRALKRGLTPLAAVALLAALIVSVGGTMAWLTTRTEAITNTFTAAVPSIVVVETFNNQTKSNVRIKNTGEVTSYIRVALIPTWQGNDKNPVGVPASLDDLDITWGIATEGSAPKWLAGEDGYWYYTEPVAPDTLTDCLIQNATVKTANGYHMNLQVLADAIQAEPTRAVTDAWGVTPDADGKISVGGNGS